MEEIRKQHSLEEKEIDLMNILSVLMKRKKYIFAITFLCITLTAVYTLFLPNIYEASGLIESAKLKKESVENVTTFRSLFTNPYSSYIKKIAKELDISEKETHGLAKSYGFDDQSGYIYITAQSPSQEKAIRMVELACTLIVERQNQLIKFALDEINNEITELKSQIQATEEELTELHKKSLQKEKTDILAQAYIYQSIIDARENAFMRRNNLFNTLRQKYMESNYDTKEAKIIMTSTPPPPLKKVRPMRRKAVLVSALIGFCIHTRLSGKE